MPKRPRTDAAKAAEAAYRERLRAAGFRPRIYLVHDEDHPTFKRQAEEARRRRLGNADDDKGR